MVLVFEDDCRLESLGPRSLRMLCATRSTVSRYSQKMSEVSIKVLHGCPRPTVPAGRTMTAVNPVISSMRSRIFFVGTVTPKNYFVFE